MPFHQIRHLPYVAFPPMTKSNLIARLAARYPQFVDKDAELAVNAILAAMTSAMVNGERTEIRGFGTFTINLRRARRGWNPKTGAKISVPEKYAPHFKPGMELRKRVDR